MALDRNSHFVAGDVLLLEATVEFPSGEGAVFCQVAGAGALNLYNRAAIVSVARQRISPQDRVVKRTSSTPEGTVIGLSAPFAWIAWDAESGGEPPEPETVALSEIERITSTDPV